MQEQIEELVRRWQDRLNLNDWNIQVVVIGHPNRKGAVIYPDFRYRKARLVVYDSRLNLEEYVLHELMHLVVGEFSNLVVRILKDRMTTQEQDLLGHEEDRLVEKLTWMLLRG
jgi:hypothetical protein